MDYRHYALQHYPKKIMSKLQVVVPDPIRPHSFLAMASTEMLFKKTFMSWGIKPVRTSFKSPWQNGVSERWVLSARTELLDHVVVLNEAHLHRLLISYIRIGMSGETRPEL